MSPFYQGVFLIVLSAFSFAFIPIFALYAYAGGASVTALLLFRFILASVCFFTYLKWKNKKISIPKNIKHLVLLGGGFYTVQSTLYFSSVKYIQVSLAVLIFYTYPIFVAIGSSLVEKEKLTKQTVGSIGISLLGLAMVLGTSFGNINVFGVLLALGAGLSYSGYFLFGNRVLKNASPLETSAFICLFASISLAVIGISSGSLTFQLTAKAWFATIGVSLVCTVLAIFTLFHGLKLIGSTRAAILSMVEPLVTILFSAILFGERMTWLQLLGGIIVLAGAVLSVLSKEREREPA
ncbi:DMT family transporter [Desulfotomaculum sp. 1211_IL3151]|uniref:DMT family transporter n=1 Tax=Desulfotomaculum sp. 1211_IL3151 TaxID=3084055 RepID=UPI002FDB3F73